MVDRWTSMCTKWARLCRGELWTVCTWTVDWTENLYTCPQAATGLSGYSRNTPFLPHSLYTLQYTVYMYSLYALTLSSLR